MAALDLKHTASMPLVTTIFLPTAPLPKTTEDVEFQDMLAPCIKKGKEDVVAPLLREMSEARRQAVSSLDPSRTISSADAIIADVRKYLSLVVGLRGKAVTEEGEEAAAPGEDGPLPGGPEAAAEDKLSSAGAKPPPAEAGEDAPPPLLPNEDGEAKTAEEKAMEEVDRLTLADGTLRRMVPFTWKDLGDGNGCSFRMGDSMLEEASTLLALAQVLLQKAKSEPLNDGSMLSIFKWLRQATGALDLSITIVREARVPPPQVPDDLKNDMLSVISEVSLAQAQHITVRRAQSQLGRNAAITPLLIAKLCNDTAERYRSMEKKAKQLCTETKKPSVGAYFVAHIRYKCLYFMALGYSMLGIKRVQQDDEDGVAYGIKNLSNALDLFQKAEMAAKKFVEMARSLVYVDDLTILSQLEDNISVCKGILDKASEANNKVFFKPIPEQPDALPDRMSNIKAEEMGEIGTNPLWTREIYACFDPSKAPDLHIGKVPEDVDCCPVS